VVVCTVEEPLFGADAVSIHVNLGDEMKDDVKRLELRGKWYGMGDAFT